MAGITWLHLSDWHQKVSSDAARNPVRERLLDDVRNRGRNISSELEQIDFIVFTGDIAYQAQINEYGAAMQQFIRPVIQAAGVDYNHLDNKTIFLVPGNHDIDRSKIAAVNARYPINFHDPAAVSRLNDYLSDPVKRSEILEPFSAYSTFIFNNFRADERDQDKQAAYFYVKLLQLAGKTVGIVGLNSAIFSGRNTVTPANGQPWVHDYGYLALTETQIDDAFREVRDADIKIALMHHPLSWLVEEDRVAVQDALSKHYHFILHGHEHMRRVEVTNSTLGNHVVIPAGSSYDRRHPGNPRYTNAYNFVHLNLDNNQATVYLRSWHETGRTWGEDTDSAPNGRVIFSIQELLNLPPPSSSQSPSLMSGCSVQERPVFKVGQTWKGECKELFPDDKKQYPIFIEIDELKDTPPYDYGGNIYWTEYKCKEYDRKVRIGLDTVGDSVYIFEKKALRDGVTKFQGEFRGRAVEGTWRFDEGEEYEPLRPHSKGTFKIELHRLPN